MQSELVLHHVVSILQIGNILFLITAIHLQGVEQDYMHHHLYDIMQSCSTAFLHGKRLICTYNAS